MDDDNRVPVRSMTIVYFTESINILFWSVQRKYDRIQRCLNCTYVFPYIRTNCRTWRKMDKRNSYFLHRFHISPTNNNRYPTNPRSRLSGKKTFH